MAELEELAFKEEDNKHLYQEIKKIKSQITKTTKSEQEFTKNIFA